jgi:alpha-amylase
MTDFILGFHCHQPLGNFDEVMLEATAKAYLPLLRALNAHPGVKVVLHFSGCLLEWADEHAPEVIDRAGALAARGQAEILGGGFYEPLLPVVPEADAIAQIDALRRWVAGRFGVKARGIWLAERVWEPALAATLARAGVEYLPVDDTHLLGAGLREADLTGAWRTGEEGASVVLYPIREALRYLIPFQPAQDCLSWLQRLGEGREHALAVMADDGEKFGVWPGTYEWVHGQGWLESFLKALEENRSWLRTTTFAERHDERPPLGSIHVPPASYFEMGEWALPVGAGRALREQVAALRKEGRFETMRPFLKGGDWRYFLKKYPEAGHRLDRVRALSAAIETAAADVAAAAPESATAPPEREEKRARTRTLLAEARRSLWRAECNCSYWHGVFGGIYLPFLREAVESALVRARRLYEEAVYRQGSWILEAPAPGREGAIGRLRLDNPRLGLTADAALGGALLDLEVKELDANIVAVMPRREEIYHDELARPAAGYGEGGPAEGAGTPSIHDRPATGDRPPVASFVYDAAPRLALLDHRYERLPSAAELAAGTAPESSLGDWRAGAGRASARFYVSAGGGREEVGLRAPTGTIRDKRIALDSQGAALAVHYLFGPSGAPTPGAEVERGPSRPVAGPELPFALWEAHGRILWTPRGGGAAREESLSSPVDLDEAASVVLTNDITGLRIALEPSPPTAVRAFPLRTISRSESGYDEIYQGTVVQVLWNVPAPGEPPARTTLLLRLFRA